MRTKLEKYLFVDEQRHQLEYCQDYLDIVDALEKAEKFINTIDSTGDLLAIDSCKTLADLRIAIRKAFSYTGEEKEDEDKDTLIYQLRKLGFTGSEQAVILNFIDIVWKNKERIK